MWIITLIIGLFILGIFAIVIGITFDDDYHIWPSKVLYYGNASLIAALGIMVILIVMAVCKNTAENKQSFKIIKADSTHIYKINESGDSLIIENR